MAGNLNVQRLHTYNLTRGFLIDVKCFIIGVKDLYKIGNIDLNEIMCFQLEIRAMLCKRFNWT